jgi:hypothetical protein
MILLSSGVCKKRENKEVRLSGALSDYTIFRDIAGNSPGSFSGFLKTTREKKKK